MARSRRSRVVLHPVFLSERPALLHGACALHAEISGRSGILPDGTQAGGYERMAGRMPALPPP